jgi:hypothetical protein
LTIKEKLSRKRRNAGRFKQKSSARSMKRMRERGLLKRRSTSKLNMKD